MFSLDPTWKEFIATCQNYAFDSDKRNMDYREIWKTAVPTKIIIDRNRRSRLANVIVIGHPRVRLGASQPINTLRPRQNRRHFADDICKHIFLNGNSELLCRCFDPNFAESSSQVTNWKLWWFHLPRCGMVPWGEAYLVGPTDKSALAQTMAWWHSLLKQICFTRPRCINPGRAEFSLRIIKIFVHFLSFHYTVLRRPWSH